LICKNVTKKVDPLSFLQKRGILKIPKYFCAEIGKSTYGTYAPAQILRTVNAPTQECASAHSCKLGTFAN